MTYLPHSIKTLAKEQNFMKRSRHPLVLINVLLRLIEFDELAKTMTKTKTLPLKSPNHM